jgi:putative membrane protein
MKQSAWLVVFFAVLIWSGIEPKDQFTWFLEVLPALIGLVVLALTKNRFPLTSLLYSLILLHCIILMVGGHYTYAEVPLFDWIRDWTGGERNNYDKVGHFAQGFIPVIICREIILRRALIFGQSWQCFFSVCFCLAFSAFYELIEWWVALLSGEDAAAFLGTQGYVWDTQSDMAWALTGALIGWFSLKALHDKQLRQLRTEKGQSQALP